MTNLFSPDSWKAVTLTQARNLPAPAQVWAGDALAHGTLPHRFAQPHVLTGSKAQGFPLQPALSALKPLEGPLCQNNYT